MGFYESSYPRCTRDTLVNIATSITLPSSNIVAITWIYIDVDMVGYQISILYFWVENIFAYFGQKFNIKFLLYHAFIIQGLVVFL